jgi:hypothetical protein
MGGEAAKKRADEAKGRGDAEERSREMHEYQSAFHTFRDDNMNSLWKKLAAKGVQGWNDTGGALHVESS